MRLTPFGKAARKWRIDHDMQQKEMAHDLGVSSAYLSAVELGLKNLDGESPIVAKLPPALRRLVYEEAVKFHTTEAERYAALVERLST